MGKETRFLVVLDGYQASVVIGLYGVFISIYGWFEMVSQHYTSVPSFGAGTLNYECLRFVLHHFDSHTLPKIVHYSTGGLFALFLVTMHLILLFGTLQRKTWMVGTWIGIGIVRFICYLVTIFFVFKKFFENQELMYETVIFVAYVCKFLLQFWLEEYFFIVVYKSFNLMRAVSKYARFQDQQNLVSNMMLEHTVVSVKP